MVIVGGGAQTYRSLFIRCVLLMLYPSLDLGSEVVSLMYLLSRLPCSCLRVNMVQELVTDTACIKFMLASHVGTCMHLC